MSHGTVVHVPPGHRIARSTGHEIVAAQLRGEAKADEDNPRAVIRSVAREIEDLGLQPDLPELEHRYGVSTPDPAKVLSQR
jgi:hypothetical protein